MIKLIILSILSLSISVYGQNLRVGLKLLPGITGTYYPLQKQAFQNRIKHRVTFNFGGQIIFGIKDSSRLFVESGIYYTDRGHLQKDFVSGYVTPSGNYTKTSDIYNHSYYVSIPLLIRLEIKHLYTSLGPTLEYLVRIKNVYTLEEDKTDISKVSGSFSDNFGLGIDLNTGFKFPLNENVGLFIEGSFNPSRFRKNPVNGDWSYFLNYELGLGVNIKL